MGKNCRSRKQLCPGKQFDHLKATRRYFSTIKMSYNAAKRRKKLIERSNRGPSLRFGPHETGFKCKELGRFS